MHTAHIFHSNQLRRNFTLVAFLLLSISNQLNAFYLTTQGYTHVPNDAFLEDQKKIILEKLGLDRAPIVLTTEQPLEDEAAFAVLLEDDF